MQGASGLLMTYNVERFMAAQGVLELEELRRRSVADPDWFWDAAISYIGIEWDVPYTAVADRSRGPEWTSWFVGGQLNFARNCLDLHAERHPEHVAITWGAEDGSRERWTYQELRWRTDGLVNELRVAGIQQGDVVGLFMPMIPEAVAAVLAVAKLGAISLPLFSGYGAGALTERLNIAGARAIISADSTRRRGKLIDMGGLAAEAAAGCAECPRVLIVSRRLDPEASSNEPVAAIPVDAEHPLFIAFTSGTTGRPKGCVHVHGGWLAQTAVSAAFQTDCRADDTLCWVSDMGWIMGPWQITAALSAGATLALFDGAPDWPNPDRLWRFIADHGVTILGMSPTLVRSLMGYGEAEVKRHDLSRLRILGSTGEPWNPEPWRWYSEVVGSGKCPVINFSGGTEVGGCFLSPYPGEHIKSCSLGGPALGMAVDVFDDDGHPVRGTMGELVCTAPWPAMTRGLLNEPERYLETYWSRFPGIWYQGDLASIDNEGAWYLHGRSDDTLKIAGKRLGPAEVESVAVAHPSVLEAVAIGVPDDRRGQALVVLIVTIPGTDQASEVLVCDEVRQSIASKLGKSFQPDEVRVVRALPKTRSGKIVRRAIRASLLGDVQGDLSSLEDLAVLRALDPLVRADGESTGGACTRLEPS
jgi:acetyl-CoA synthetase